MNRIFRNMLKSSIFPSVLLVSTKFIGVLLGIYLSKATYSIDGVHDYIYLMKIIINSETKYRFVTFTSDVLVSIVFIVAGSITLAFSSLFSKINQHPKILINVVNYDLIDLLEDADYTYPKLIIWNIYSWLTAVIILNDIMKNDLNFILVVPITVFALVFTYIVFNSIEKHINLISFTNKHEKPQIN